MESKCKEVKRLSASKDRQTRFEKTEREGFEFWMEQLENIEYKDIFFDRTRWTQRIPFYAYLYNKLTLYIIVHSLLFIYISLNNNLVWCFFLLYIIIKFLRGVGVSVSFDENILVIHLLMVWQSSVKKTSQSNEMEILGVCVNST